jgi:hypothetical protein
MPVRMLLALLPALLLMACRLRKPETFDLKVYIHYQEERGYMLTEGLITLSIGDSTDFRMLQVNPNGPTVFSGLPVGLLHDSMRIAFELPSARRYYRVVGQTLNTAEADSLIYVAVESEFMETTHRYFLRDSHGPLSNLQVRLLDKFHLQTDEQGYFEQTLLQRLPGDTIWFELGRNNRYFYYGLLPVSTDTLTVKIDLNESRR